MKQFDPLLLEESTFEQPFSIGGSIFYCFQLVIFRCFVVLSSMFAAVSTCFRFRWCKWFAAALICILVRSSKSSTDTNTPPLRLAPSRLPFFLFAKLSAFHHLFFSWGILAFFYCFYPILLSSTSYCVTLHHVHSFYGEAVFASILAFKHCSMPFQKSTHNSSVFV